LQAAATCLACRSQQTSKVKASRPNKKSCSANKAKNTKEKPALLTAASSLACRSQSYSFAGSGIKPCMPQPKLWQRHHHHHLTSCMHPDEATNARVRNLAKYTRTLGVNDYQDFPLPDRYYMVEAQDPLLVRQHLQHTARRQAWIRKSCRSGRVQHEVHSLKAKSRMAMHGKGGREVVSHVGKGVPQARLTRRKKRLKCNLAG
jgi:hypothetical protein